MRKFIFTLTILFLNLICISQSWNELSSLPYTISGLHHPISFSIDGYGYLVTGVTDEFGKSKKTDDFYKYDPIEDSWEQLESFPGGERGYAYGVTSGGKAYIGFGYDSESNTNNDLWEYDADENKWTELSECPCGGRAHPAFVAIDGKLFVGLGSTGSGGANDWWEYDIETDQWEQKPDFPSLERHHPYFFSLNNIIYVGFGHGGPNIFNDFYKYHPVEEKWEELNPFPSQGRVAGTEFSHNGKGYILSGQGENHLNLETGEFWEYDPDLDTWHELEAHPGSGRWAPGSFVIDNMLYFTCGKAESLKKDLWSYELPQTISTAIDHPVTNNFLKSNGHNSYSIHSLINNSRLKIYNISGALLETIRVDEFAIQLSLNHLSSGIYILLLEENAGIRSQKVQIH